MIAAEIPWILSEETIFGYLEKLCGILEGKNIEFLQLVLHRN